MKRFAVLVMTGLTLASGLADAGRRSGGGFGGSRSSRSYSSSSSSWGGSGSYRAPGPAPRYVPAPRYTPPPDSSASSPYTAPRFPTTPRTPSGTQRRATLPSSAAVRKSPLNAAAAARVTPAQLDGWNKLKLPAGVSRSAITYSAAPSSQYRYQLQPGRYYPYPQSYYRQHGIGYDLLKYAVIFTAVSSVANAVTPHPAPFPYPSYNTPVLVQQSGPNLWTYAGVGCLAAAAAWFLLGRRR